MKLWRVLAVGAFGILVSGCAEAPADPEAGRSENAAAAVAFTERERSKIATLSPLPPPPDDPTNRVADDPIAARFGHRLFFDTRLSANGEISCATCHDPRDGFSDGNTLAEALDTLDRHTMTLWNVAYNRWYFWDGRVDTLWGQALDPLEEPREHGTDRLHCAHVIAGDPALRDTYERIFGPLPDLEDEARFPAHARPRDTEDEASAAWSAMRADDRHAVDHVFANMGKALAAYQRKLVSRRSPFDVFAEGLAEGDDEKIAALSPSAQRGLQLFLGKANCTLCHFGPNFTDGEFHSTGVPPLDGGPLHDEGRYKGIARLKTTDFAAGGQHSDDPTGETANRAAAVVHGSESWGQFKTPSLRNVAVTAPYMHQGQFETLTEVVRHYSTLEDAVLPSHHTEQLLVPLDLSATEIIDLVAFLESLTDVDVPVWLTSAPDP